LLNWVGKSGYFPVCFVFYATFYTEWAPATALKFSDLGCPRHHAENATRRIWLFKRRTAGVLAVACPLGIAALRALTGGGAALLDAT
jgi:hypothetical protein